MGLCLVLALVSGVVLYAPFARKPGFATVRRGKSNRLRWLDWHNVIGGVTLAWAMVVGVTGTINTLADPITAWWRADALAHLVHDRNGAVLPYRPGWPKSRCAMPRRQYPAARCSSWLSPAPRSAAAITSQSTSRVPPHSPPSCSLR
jgi:uncharacterized iron-regulated membrane protein